jgi:L-gulonate 3-dehydrogenase
MTNTAAVVGAGLIGRAWAMVFARAGWEVRLTDHAAPQLDAAREFVAASLEEQARHGMVRDPAAAAARIHYVPTIEDAVAGSHWIQENLPETVAAKQQAFATFDRHAAPDAVLASSTSALPASQFTESLAGRARCLVAHPVNPPHLVPVVELCGAPWTTAATIGRAQAVMTSVGQVPILVRRELDGFVLNRLQGALLAEAMRLVGEGYVSPEDLDRTVRDGLGLRWSFMGPFATIALNAPGGVADYCARYAGFYRRLAASPPDPEVWGADNAARVASALGPPPAAGELAARTRWRDRRLLALREHQRAQPDFDHEDEP